MLNFIIIVLIFTSYVGFLMTKYGVLPSISESYYRLPNKRKYLFILFLWGIGFPTAILGDTLSAFLVLVGLGIVGGASLFKSKVVGIMHYVGATVAIGSAHAYVAVELGYWWLTAIFLIGGAGIVLLKYKNRTWWVELLAFATAIIGFGLKVF